MALDDRPSPLQRQLTEALDTAQVFAVVDAAHIDYLQDTLTMERFTFDPLYLDEVDNPSVASGPHLVHPTGPAQIARLREIVGDAPACVWWVWPDEPGAGEAIYRHLRGLNMIEIPKDRFDVPPEQREPGYESVLFRHGDSNVMTTMIDICSPMEHARIFGKASTLVVGASESGSMRIFERGSASISGRPRMLRLQAESYALLWDHELRRHWNLADRPETADAAREASLFDAAVEWIERENIREPENIRFVFRMTTVTDGGFLTAEPIRKLLREADGQSDTALTILQRHQRYGDR